MFGIPGGVAVITPLEQTDQDGVTLSDGSRWALDTPPLQQANFTKYLGALLRGRQGYYRAFVFLFTTEVVIPSGSFSVADLRTLYRGGALQPPKRAARQPVTPSHQLWVLVYEFNKTESATDPVSVIPGRFTAAEHLRRAGVLNAIERGNDARR